MAVDDADALVHARQLGELPVLLRPDPVWNDDVGQRVRTVRLDEEFVDGLYTLAHPGIEYGAVIRTNGRQRCLFVAEHGRQVVVAERAGDLLTMTTARDRSALAELVRRLPEATPATIEAVNLRRSELAAHGSSVMGFGLGASVRRRDLNTVAMLMGRALVGQGELHVGVHDRFGRTVRSEPVRYQDYELGRVLVVVSGDFVSLAPATKSSLTRRLAEEQQRITCSLSA
jgi:hypothetical protein